MPDIPLTAVIGMVAGLVASFVMNLYQTATASLFGQDGEGEPATEKAAHSVKRKIAGGPVQRNRRHAAGMAVHYATGLAIGLGYALIVLHWPTAAIGFGIAFGIVVAVILDGLLVPGLGWGPWPWRTGPATYAYSLTSHIVFGLALEGVRRAGVGLLA